MVKICQNIQCVVTCYKLITPCPSAWFLNFLSSSQQVSSDFLTLRLLSAPWQRWCRSPPVLLPRCAGWVAQLPQLPTRRGRHVARAKAKAALLDAGGYAGSEGQGGVTFMGILGIRRHLGKEEGFASWATKGILKQIGELGIAIRHMSRGTGVTQGEEYICQGGKGAIDAVGLLHLKSFGLRHFGSLTASQVHNMQNSHRNSKIFHRSSWPSQHAQESTVWEREDLSLDMEFIELPRTNG